MKLSYRTLKTSFAQPSCSPVRWQGAVPSEGRRNRYRCFTCGEDTNTIHADEGVTPAAIACHFCGEVAYSMFYSQEVPGPIHGVWSKVPNSWWGDADAQRDHAVKGGVFLYSVMEGAAS